MLYDPYSKTIVYEDKDVTHSTPKMPAQELSTATSVAALKADLNALLVKLKEAGFMKDE